MRRSLRLLLAFMLAGSGVAAPAMAATPPPSEMKQFGDWKWFRETLRTGGKVMVHCAMAARSRTGEWELRLGVSAGTGITAILDPGSSGGALGAGDDLLLTSGNQSIQVIATPLRPTIVKVGTQTIEFGSKGVVNLAAASKSGFLALIGGSELLTLRLPMGRILAFPSLGAAEALAAVGDCGERNETQ